MKLLRSLLVLLAVALPSLTVALCFCVPTFSQVTQGPPVAQDLRISDWNFGERIPPVANLPFTATVEFETVNQLSDGTVISHKTFNQIARDSLGRTRHEVHQWIGANGSQETRVIRITLYDPATRTKTELSPLTKTARAISGTAPYPVSSLQPGSKTASSREDLGAQTIEGLQVRGERISQTFPANILGNDRPSPPSIGIPKNSRSTCAANAAIRVWARKPFKSRNCCAGNPMRIFLVFPKAIR
jgi:hypothetical protein